MANTQNQARSGALAQLKAADELIREGRQELAAANKKIAKAQRLIDESATILRDSWGAKKSRPSLS
jgi:flagellin-specific chaperone FliS